MKYKLLLIFNVLLCFTCLAQNKSKNDLVKENIYGKVKSLTEYGYDVNLKDINSNITPSSKTISVFNEFGKIIERKLFRGKDLNSLAHSQKFIYDNKGRLLKVLGKDEKIIKTLKYNYNNKNNLVEKVYLSDRISSQIIYNSFGERDTFYRYREGEPVPTVVYSYDAKGNLVKEINYKNDKILNYEVVYEYDIYNNRIKENRYDSNGIKTGRTSFKYDPNKNLLVRIDSNLTFIGGLPRVKIGDKLGSQTFKYELLDKHRNWKTKLYLINNKEFVLMKREITYY